MSKLKESHSNDVTEKEADLKRMKVFKKSRIKRFITFLLKEQYELKIEEEIEKQRIVERKAAVTVRELKKQLSAEKKRAEKLAEKIKTVDSAEIETVATNRLSVPLNKDETSSIGSWSLPTGEFENLKLMSLF